MDADWRGRCGSNTVTFTGQFAGTGFVDEHDGGIKLGPNLAAVRIPEDMAREYQSVDCDLSNLRD